MARRRWLVAIPIFVLVALGWEAIRDNAVTYDETAFIPANYAMVVRGDYRLVTGHPPLAHLASGLGLLGLDINESASAQQVFAHALRQPFASYIYGDRIMYRDNAPHPIAVRARLPILIAGVALLTVVFAWGRHAFGLPGGLLATALLAVDPNILAHASLATTDLVFTVCYVLTLWLVWRALQRLTLGRVLAAAAACGAAFAAKFSSLALGPLTLLLAAGRVLDRSPWPTGNAGEIATAGRRAGAAGLVLLALAVGSVTILWGVYGFRYAANADGTAGLPIESWVSTMRRQRVFAGYMDRHDGRKPDNATVRRLVSIAEPAAAERAIAIATEHRLLPESYLLTFTVMTAASHNRPAYALGQQYHSGWPWFFPFALLVKTPVGTLVLVLATWLLLAIDVGRHPRAPGRADARVLGLGALVFLGVAIVSEQNTAYRHVLPVLVCGVAAVGWLPSRLASLIGQRATAAVLVIALGATVAETWAVRPHFLSFFNRATGGPRAGIDLLSSDNLDWGQALGPLATWMRAHDVEHVNLAYFGTADPRAYGIASFTPLLGSYHYDLGATGRAGYESGQPRLPGYVAVSATVLSGAYLSPRVREHYAFLRAQEPAAVPGNAIYVYWVDRWNE